MTSLKRHKSGSLVSDATLTQTCTAGQETCIGQWLNDTARKKARGKRRWARLDHAVNSMGKARG